MDGRSARRMRNGERISVECNPMADRYLVCIQIRKAKVKHVGRSELCPKENMFRSMYIFLFRGSVMCIVTGQSRYYFLAGLGL